MVVYTEIVWQMVPDGLEPQHATFYEHSGPVAQCKQGGIMGGVPNKLMDGSPIQGGLGGTSSQIPQNLGDWISANRNAGQKMNPMSLWGALHYYKNQPQPQQPTMGTGFQGLWRRGQ